MRGGDEVLQFVGARPDFEGRPAGAAQERGFPAHPVGLEQVRGVVARQPLPPGIGPEQDVDDQRAYCGEPLGVAEDAFAHHAFPAGQPARECRGRAERVEHVASLPLESLALEAQQRQVARWEPGREIAKVRRHPLGQGFGAQFVGERCEFPEVAAERPEPEGRRQLIGASQLVRTEPYLVREASGIPAMADQADGALAGQFLGRRAEIGERLAALGSECLRELPGVEAHDHVLTPRGEAPERGAALVLVKQTAEQFPACCRARHRA